MRASARLARTRPCAALASVVVGFGALGLVGCSERDSYLIAAASATEPEPTEALVLPQAVQDAIDERPLGGASLTSGTTGGGTYAEARAAGALFRVATLSELELRVSGDEPAVVVIEAGSYVGETAARSVAACHQPCAADDPRREQTVAAASCTNGEALFDVAVTSDSLRIGSNKTIIGLDAGAWLDNVSVSLDGSSNVIVRNIGIKGVDSEVPTGSDGFSLRPSNHVWLDHVSLRDISHSALPIVSSWDQEQDQAIVEEAGYVTISNADFDGFLDSSCSQRSESVLTTNRSPALTITRSLFRNARIRVPNLFGPGTWAHLFNNLWDDIDGRGLAVSCGAAAIAQGNVLERAHNGLYNSDSGLPDWQFCATGFYGVLYAPTEEGSVEANLLDAASSQNLGGQPATGDGLTLPVSLGGSEYEVTVPVASGTETYRFTLAPDPAAFARELPESAGVGHLF